MVKSGLEQTQMFQIFKQNHDTTYPMEKNVPALSWEDIASRLPAGYLLDNDQKSYLFDQIARRIDKSATTKDAYWKIIEDEIDFRFPDAG